MTVGVIGEGATPSMGVKYLRSSSEPLVSGIYLTSFILLATSVLARSEELPVVARSLKLESIVPRLAFRLVS